MHAIIEQKPKISHLILPTVISHLRLKQGDNLSPIEFKLFLMTSMKYSMKLVTPYLWILKGTLVIYHLLMYSLSKAGL